MDENLLWGCRTLNTVFARLTWSLNLLFYDVYPSVGQFGEPLSPAEEKLQGQEIVGKKFCVTELRGDWSWVRTVWRCKSSWKGGERVPVCHLCPSYNSGPNKYYMVHENEPIWDQQFGLVDFLTQQMPSKHACRLFGDDFSGRSQAHSCC